MNKNQILAEVEEIFRDVLDNEEIELQETTTADEVEEWDSLTHIQLIVAIEKHFKVKFTAQEIMGWNTVGEMCECIANK